MVTCDIKDSILNVYVTPSEYSILTSNGVIKASLNIVEKPKPEEHIIEEVIDPRKCKKKKHNKNLEKIVSSLKSA